MGYYHSDTPRHYKPDYAMEPDYAQPDYRSCPGKITTVWCWEHSSGRLQDLAFWNTDTGSHYLGCSGATLPSTPATGDLFLSDNESIIATETCGAKRGWAFESVTFVTNKGRTLTCGAPRGLPFKEEGHTTAQADDTAPTTSQARSLLAAVTDMGVAAGESDSEGEGQDDDAEVARVRGKGRKQHKTRPGGDSRKKRRGDKDMADRRQGKKGRKPGYNQPPHSHEPDYPQEPDAPYHQHPYMPDYQQPGYGDYPYGPAHRRCQVFKAPKHAPYRPDGRAASISPLADFAAGCTPTRRVASVHSFCFNKAYEPPLPPNGSVPVDLVINLGDSTTRPCPTTPQQVQQLYADLETISQQVRVVSIIPPSQQPIIDRIVWQPFNPSMCNVAQQASAIGQRQLLQLDNTTITIQGSFVPGAGFTGTDVTDFLDANLSRDLCDLTTAPSVAPPVRVCTGTEFESIPYSLPQALQRLSLSVKPAVDDGMVSGSPTST